MTVKWQRVANSLLGTIEESFEDTFADQVKKLERSVNTVHKRFFKKLVMKAIDRKSAPSFGEFTPVWKPLGGKYLDAKKKAGQSTGFYKKTGELKTTLQALEPKTILGSPLVSFAPSGFVGRAGVASRREKWNGSSSKRRVIRDSRGRFAKAEDIPRFLKATISVDPYPKILQDATKGIIDETTVFDKDTAEKLKNPNGKRLRPLFTNYLNWFLEVELKKAVKKSVKL